MMKKGTKEILSGVLALSIVLCTPAGMAAVEAVGQQGALLTGDGGGTAGHCSETMEENLTEAAGDMSGNLAEAAGDMSEHRSEKVSESKSDTFLEKIEDKTPENESDLETEHLSEIISEDQSDVSISKSEDPSEIISEQLPNKIPEKLSRNNSETESGDISKSISEANPKVNSEEYAELESSAKEDWNGSGESKTDALDNDNTRAGSATQGWVDNGEANLEVNSEENSEVEGSREEESNPEANLDPNIRSEDGREEGGIDDSERNLKGSSEQSAELENSAREESGISSEQNLESDPNENMKPEDSREEERVDNSESKLEESSEESTQLEISTVEESTSNSEPKLGENTEPESNTKEESSDTGETNTETASEGSTEPEDSIEEESIDNSERNPEESAESEGRTEEESKDKSEANPEESAELENSTEEESIDNSDETIYIEEVQNNAEEEAQKQDIYAPMLKELWVESKRHEAANSDSEQFIVKNFVLKGTFCGKVNRVNKIEYTTNLQPEKDSVWLEAKNTQTTESKGTETEFQIALPEGTYPSIAVRAYDEAGNVSGVGQLVSDSGESLKVVVEQKDNAADRTAQDQSAGQPAIKRTIKLKTTKPELSESAVTNPEIPKPEVTKPEAMETEAATPKVTKPDTAKPEVLKPEVTKPGVIEPEATKPEIAKPQVIESEATKPGIIKAEEAKSGILEPEITKQEVTKSDTAKPEVLKPEVTKADAAETEVRKPEVMTPEVSHLEISDSKNIKSDNTNLNMTNPETVFLGALKSETQNSNPEAPKQITARLDEIQQKNANSSLTDQKVTKSDLIPKVLLQPEEVQSKISKLQLSELQNTIKTADPQTSMPVTDYLLSDKMAGNSSAINANTLLVDNVPEIQISFQDSSASSENIYRQKRTATVRVLETDFNPAAVRIPITKDNQPLEVKLSDWTSDGNEHYATFELAEEGKYSIAAGNVNLSDQTETFIIDRIAPKMTVDLVPAQKAQTAFNAAAGNAATKNAAANNTVENDSFNTKVTAVIRVTEHNFREEDFAINMSSVSEKGTWSHDGDVHTLQITFDEDDAYHLECAYADLNGNAVKAVKRDFLIDTAAPTIAIDGVENNSANNSAVCPVISVEDSNMELSDISVSVMTGTGDLVQSAIDTELVSSENGTSYRLTLTDIAEQPDNVYHLLISACDKAGNVTEQTYRFSLNRNGSVYDLTSLKQLMDQKYSTYKALNDIQIAEMNMDSVEDFELYISRNGALGYKAEYTKEISGSADVGYTYLYRVNKENFAEEGTYRLTMYSKDRAGNEVNNATDINGDEITFVVDNTAPKVVIDGVASGMVYKTESQKVHVAVIDNFKLDEAELFLVNEANEVLKRWDYIALAGEDGALDITIPQYNGKLSLLYRVKDATGNEVQTFRGDTKAPSDFIVNANKFAAVSMNFKIICMTGGLGLSVILFLVFISRKRRQPLL